MGARSLAGKQALYLVGAALFGLAAAPARAEEATAPADAAAGQANPEIVVTAAKRAQNIQDVPMAVTAISGDALAGTGVTDVAGLVTKAPGLAFQRPDHSQNRLSIRGLTSLSGTVSEFPMVGTYVDDVPISENSIPDVGLIDLERVEVLRGPQGTLYGEGSMGGTVRFISRKPSLTRLEGFVAGEVSTTPDGGASYSGSAALNLPLVKDKAALRVSGYYLDDGGFVTNAANGAADADAYHRYGARATLLLAPVEQLTITLTGAYQLYKGGIEPAVFPEQVAGITPPLLTRFGPTIAYRQAPTYARDELTIANGVVAYDFGFATLTSSTSYYKRNYSGAEDESQTARQVEAGFSPITEALGLGPLTLTHGVQTTYTGPNKTFAQELRLSSNGKTRLRYTLGAYYRTRDVSSADNTYAPDLIGLNQILLAVPPAYGGPFSSNPTYQGELQISSASVAYRQVAVFGEATYGLTDAIDLTAGLRYANERVHGSQALTVPNFAFGPGFLTLISSNFPDSTTTEGKVLWKLGASYKPARHVLLYVQAATGFRPGGVNARANPTPGADSPRTFASDSVTSYELGAKTEWLDGALTANLAAYWSILSNAQFSDYRDTLFPVIRNSGGAQTRGIELELAAHPTRNLTFGVSATVMKATFSQNALPFDPGNGSTVYVINAGQRLPTARDGAFSGYAEWKYPLSPIVKLVTYADVSAVGDTPANTVRADTGAAGDFYILKGYTQVNAQIGLETSTFSVTAFVQNAFNTLAELGGTQAFGISRNKPRTIGLRARADF